MDPIKFRFSFTKHGGSMDNGYWLKIELPENEAPSYAQLVTLLKGKWLEASVAETAV